MLLGRLVLKCAAKQSRRREQSRSHARARSAERLRVLNVWSNVVHRGSFPRSYASYYCTKLRMHVRVHSSVTDIQGRVVRCSGRQRLATHGL